MKHSIRGSVAVATMEVLALGGVARAQLLLDTDVTNLSGFGAPLLAVIAEVSGGDTANFKLFADGQIAFAEIEGLPTLGPIFNARACGGCHFQPALGGSGGSINEVRIRKNTAGGPLHIFATDNILRLGPQRQGGVKIFPTGVEATPLGCQITHPKCRQSRCQEEEAHRTTFSTSLPICDPTSRSFGFGANCTAERQATPLFGFGLIEAIADSTFTDIANAQPEAIRGTVKTVNELGATRVARFGWKNDVATLRGFAGDAYLNEMGITNPDFPTERSECVLNGTQFGVLLDAVDDPEDTVDGETGRADIDKFADFMRMLDPPPRLAQNESARAGRLLFHEIGCGGCHLETITTALDPLAFVPLTAGGINAISPSLNGMLANQQIHPYSDFLLHDMGSLGDGITSGAAGPRQMRTAPLWGVRAKGRFLHDGRAESITDAIRLHDGQGAAARTAFFNRLPLTQRRILDFLNTI
jgi:CxxC motif-containing protein (DUF1111 family)